MRAKTLTLYSLPYLVGIASLMVAAHEVAPSILTLRASPAATPRLEQIFGQTVNRAAKGDRLPIRQSAPAENGKQRPQAAPNTIVVAVR
jgi:hypothetical protein